MRKSALEKLTKVLKSRKKDVEKYLVPKIWVLDDNFKTKKELENEVLVNPYDFYSSIINNYIFKYRKKGINYSLSLSKALNLENTNGDWINESVIYSSFVRASSSWDHDKSYSIELENTSGMKETGTFVKMLALLPLLKRMGVSVLYLLPVSKYSEHDKKGEMGSPYSVENFTELDQNLKDPLTGDDMTLDEEFNALIEACHILDIRVTIDIIPRTNSITSSLIKEHPDWFYWIKSSEKSNYRVPYVDGIPSTTYPSFELMREVLSSSDVLRHIKMFEKNPKEIDREKYDSINQKDSVSFIKEIKEQFDLEVAPAFSDQINDIQPPWTDVTYFRLFLDEPVKTKNFLKIKHNPYILSNTIKCDLYPGKEPNLGLWELLSDIIPVYQKRYGIDGARIDMGHALPDKLLDMIMKKAKTNDPDFSFIAEELNMGNDLKAKNLGYNAIIGNGFWAEPRIFEGELKRLIDNAPLKSLPFFASCETHDSRRATFREGGEKLTRFLTVLNYFIPRSIPFICSGQEVYEKEPMNIGLDSSREDLEALDKNDFLYQKLALFDKYAFHYTNPNAFEIINHLRDVIETRKCWLKTITNVKNYLPIHFYEDKNYLIGLSYFNRETGKCLLIIGNGNMHSGEDVIVSLDLLRNKAKNSNTHARLLYGTYEFPRDFYDFNYQGDLKCYLGSGEIKIYEF